MFVILLVVLLAAAAVHIARTGEWTAPRIGEVVLLYVVIGYCGVPMLVVSIGILTAPERVAEMLGFPPGNPFQTFLGVAYLALSLLAVLALRYRGRFLIAPAVGWAVFFAGATFIHLTDYGARGALTHGSMLAIFASHGLISLLLLGGLLSSGLLKDVG